MIRFVVAIGSLLALGISTAAAGRCTEEISNLEKERAAAASKMNLASAPDAKKVAEFNELMMRARKADGSKREQDCLEAVQEARRR